MYYHGQGVPQSFAEAKKWLESAATQNHADAQYSLGLLYEQGEGVSQSVVETKKWYEKAAAQGHHDAQTQLHKITSAP